MTAINFTVFTNKVVDGSKRQTIRKTDRKGQIRAGVPLQLYTGMRTKACRKLVDVDPICVSVERIEILPVHYRIEEKKCSWRCWGLKVAGEVWGKTCASEGDFWDTQTALNAFAVADGFETFVDMWLFFDEKYGLPFKGVLIKW